jgi:UrcA family protein
MNIRNTVQRIALLAGATLLATGACALPLNDGTVTRSETIRYISKDAYSEAGAVALYQKLYDAALHVCSDPDAARTSNLSASVDKSCLGTALDKAVRHVGSPMVTALNLQNHSGMAMLAIAMKPIEVKIDTVASR